MTFDISSLGDVDSPDLVRAALRRFRRRMLRVFLAIVLAGSLAGAIVVALNREFPTFADDLEKAAGVRPNVVLQQSGVTLVVRKVAKVDRGTGFQFLVVAIPPEGREIDVEFGPRGVVRGDDPSGSGPVLELTVALEVPSDGRFDVVIKHLPPERCEESGAIRFCTRGELRQVPPGSDPRDDPRILARFTIDLRSLGVPEEMWR